MSYFVQPDTTVLTLEDGATLVVRARLNHGEQRAMFGRLYTRGPSTVEAPAGALQVNPNQVGVALVTAYLLEWSLCDAAGRPVRIDHLATAELERVLDNLTPEAFDTIHAAIAAHDARGRMAIAEQKKTLTGSSVS